MTEEQREQVREVLQALENLTAALNDADVSYTHVETAYDAVTNGLMFSFDISGDEMAVLIEEASK